MLDIKLITFHSSLSYGGCLQTIAIVRLFSKMGVDITVIDYENEFEARKRNGQLFKHGTYKEILEYIIKDLFFKGKWCRRRAFGNIKSEYTSITKEYCNIVDLEKLRADVFVVGSDQVWNGSITNGVDEIFLLSFAGDSKRVSLSSSMGSYHPKHNEEELFKNELRKFSSISVREVYAKNILERIVGKEIDVLIDPTLMLSKNEWQNIAFRGINHITEGKYILVFVINKHSTDMTKIYKYYKNILKLPVLKIMLNTYKSRSVDKVVAGPTPEEFVELIGRASFVITDSFHGLAFSINMNVPFAFINVEGNNDRMSELLDNCGLLDRALKDNKMVDIDCDFSTANTFLESERIKSKKWIWENILDD